MYRRLYLSMISMMVYCAAVSAAAVGTWKIHRSYSTVEDIVPTGSMVYVQANGNLYSYRVSDNTVQTYDKQTGLGAQDIRFIAWGKNAGKLVIVYEDYTVDLLSKDGSVESIVSIKEKRTTKSKTVNNLVVYGDYAYLCTASGVIKVNMKNATIADTYTIDDSVYDLVVKDNTIYIRTIDTVYEAGMDANLIDKSVWNESDKEWTELSGDDQMVVTPTTFYVYDTTNKCYWGSDENGKLIRYIRDDAGDFVAQSSGVMPEGPAYPEHAVVRIYNGKIHTLRGLYNMDKDSGADGYVQTYDGNTWSVFDNTLADENDYKHTDYMTMDIDPKNSRRIMVGSKNGLFEYIDGKMTRRFNSDNTENLVGGDNTVIVSMSYDDSGNLWLFNRFNSALQCYTKDGEWKSYPNETLQKLDGGISRYVSTFFDSRGLMWFCKNHFSGNFFGFYNKNTDEVKLITEIVNQDGKNINPVNTYNSRVVTEDEEGNIWLGTNYYTVYLNPADIKTMMASTSTSGIAVTQHKVARNDGTGLADYLLNGIAVRDIKTDAANRKWVATDNNGVYLISNDCNTELEHFTTENSPLPSNDVYSICVDDKNGKVYFGTLKGLCEYSTGMTADYGELQEDNVYAYPNPVPPEYTGDITIKGLIENAQLKITTSSGYVVHEGVSNGPVYKWDGCDKSGERVASGVYMVLVVTATGEQGCVTKIAVVK